MASSGPSTVFDRLHPGIQRWILGSGWSGLRPIQEAAIPVILDGHDCVVEAPTAGGKTEAVLFPSLSRVSSRPVPGVRLLYLAPLRALLNDLELRAERYAGACGLESFKWHGDVDQRAKLRRLRQPPALLLTTPESVEAILLRKQERAALFSHLQTVILDEAHNFAAGDRGGHLLSLLERLEELAGHPFQRIALSATVGNPEAMLRWLAGRDRSLGRRVRVGGQPADRDFLVRFFGDEGDVQSRPEASAGYRRFKALSELLPGSRSLVFVRSRAGAERLAKGFAEFNHRLPTGRRLRVQTHHSAVSKYYREQAEHLIRMASELSEDRLDAIISSSTLELGIDIGELDHVIQMDALPSPSSFLQRVGRTGRRRGKPQFFRGLCTDAEDLVVLTAAVSLGSKGHSEKLRLPGRAFHLLAHQLICLALQAHGVPPDRAWRVLSRAHCFSRIRQAEFERLVRHMIEQEYLRSADGVLVAGDATERHFLRAGWRRLFAVFDSGPLYEVLHRRQAVGTLDAGFVEALEVPFFFVLGGKLWKAEAVDGKRRTVLATPSRAGEAPSWTSFGGPGVPFETAQEAGRLLHGHEPLPSFLDPQALGVMRFLVKGCSESTWQEGEILLQPRKGGAAGILTYGGDRINRTLARSLQRKGFSKCTARYDAVEVVSDFESRSDLERGLVSALETISGSPSPATRLASDLQQSQPLWPHSPFSRCLPEDLWAAALVDSTLDCQGLVRLLQGATLRVTG
ncbi:MAG: DEAD/DEAH box helicase [bacterium]